LNPRPHPPPHFYFGGFEWREGAKPIGHKEKDSFDGRKKEVKMIYQI
jgi:hypothetical protein